MTMHEVKVKTFLFNQMVKHKRRLNCQTERQNFVNESFQKMYHVNEKTVCLLAFINVTDNK